MIASGFCWDKFQKIFKETDKVLATYLVFLKMSTIFKLFLYYLKHEHECFIRYKMRGAAERFIHSQKRHRLAASCGFYRLAASLSTSCSKLVNFIKLQQVCENQTCCNLIFADLLQVVETTCIKLANIKSQLSNCIKPVDNLQQTCYRQA